MKTNTAGNGAPFYIDDLAALREKLTRAERDGTRMGQVWSSVRRRVRAKPDGFPWLAPFTALVTGEPRDLEAARSAVRNYVATFDDISFSMGLQFHFWCFAFPHARWALYCQWLDSIGAWTPEEAAHLREELVRFQFVNFFYGMRTKPEPECVDNQSLSLCFSNGLVGHLYGDGAPHSAVAQRMLTDGLRRLPPMLGGFPPSGYSGEGSTYMDLVVGPCVPYVTEFLERVAGGDWFSKPLPPHGGSAEAVVRMIAREWMPGGLLLPWDHYGYFQPARSCIAYGARRTGDPLYLRLLEEDANWSQDAGVGWGFDDLVWSLVWWPDRGHAAAKPMFVSWCAEEVGGALVSTDAQFYLMQMWDPSTPRTPGRAHVNPNALVLSAWGSPLTADGVPHKGCTAFNFDDTWLEVTCANFTPVRSNFGSGCGGAHGVLLLDGWEGMRAMTEYKQAGAVQFDAAGKSLQADVAPIYRERWPDVRMVRRKSTLCAERFWLIEDLAVSEKAHAVTARWYLRPAQVAAERGVAVETAEGVRLRLLPLLGPDGASVRRIEGFPDRLDGESLRVDFTQQGAECRWLWLAWPENTREVVADLAADWTAAADPQESLDLAAAQRILAASDLRLPFTQPPFLLADLPVVRRWWFRKTVAVPPDGPCWLRLPRQMFDPRVWIDGRAVDMSSHALRMNLLPPQIALTEASGGKSVEVVVSCACGVSQYGKDDHEGTGFSGEPALLRARTGAAGLEASYAGGAVTIRAEGRSWTVPYRLMEAAQ